MLFFFASSVTIISLSELFLQQYCIIIKQYDLNNILLDQHFGIPHERNVTRAIWFDLRIVIASIYIKWRFAMISIAICYSICNKNIRVKDNEDDDIT